jgi:hypothetical protein
MLDYCFTSAAASGDLPETDYFRLWGEDPVATVR